MQRLRNASIRSSGWVIGGLCAVLLGGAGCGGDGDPAAEKALLETEDVGEGVAIDTSADVREAARAPALGGVLPEDFPSDLPLYLPASIVDIVPGTRVDFLSSSSRARVESDLLSRLRSEGWTVREAGSSRWSVTRSGKTRALSLEDARPGTRYSWSW